MINLHEGDEIRNLPHVPRTSAVQTCVDGPTDHASRITHVCCAHCTCYGRMGGVGAMDAKRLSPRRE